MTNQTTTIALIKPPPRILASINVGAKTVGQLASLGYPSRCEFKHCNLTRIK
jgi:hypothetical protein